MNVITKSWQTFRQRQRTLRPWTWQWIAGAVVIAAAVVGLSIGFDDTQLTEYQLEYARLLATVLGGVAVFVSAFRYVWERQQELAWRRTEFMAGLFKELEDRPALRRAQALIDDSYKSGDDTYLVRILGGVDGLREDELSDRRRIDRYLDFFDHLYTYAFVTRTIPADEAISFSGYVIDILDSSPVSDFCFEMGYEDVLRLAVYFRDRAAELSRAEQSDELRAEVEAKRRS